MKKYRLNIDVTYMNIAYRVRYTMQKDKYYAYSYERFQNKK